MCLFPSSLLSIWFHLRSLILSSMNVLHVFVRISFFMGRPKQPQPTNGESMSGWWMNGTRPRCPHQFEKYPSVPFYIITRMPSWNRSELNIRKPKHKIESVHHLSTPMGCMNICCCSIMHEYCTYVVDKCRSRFHYFMCFLSFIHVFWYTLLTLMLFHSQKNTNQPRPGQGKK